MLSGGREREREREKMLKRERGKVELDKAGRQAVLGRAVQGISQVFLATVLFINQLSFLCTRLAFPSPYCSPPAAAAVAAAVNRCT